MWSVVLYWHYHISSMILCVSFFMALATYLDCIDSISRSVQSTLVLRIILSRTIHGSSQSSPSGDPTLPYFQPPHFDPPPIPSYSSRRVHSETPIYVPPHSCLWVMGHHSNISSSICTHLHAYAHLWIHMCTDASRCTSTTTP